MYRRRAYVVWGVILYVANSIKLNLTLKYLICTNCQFLWVNIALLMNEWMWTKSNVVAFQF